MKHMLLLAGAGIAGYLIYRHFHHAQTGNLTYSKTSMASKGYANPGLLAQPSLRYPITPAVSPRVDNSSQPWYGGSRAFNMGADSKLGNLNSIFTDIHGTASAVSDVKSIWDDLNVSSLTDGGGDSFSTDSSTGSVDWSQLGATDA